MTDMPIIFSAPMVAAILREVGCPGTGKTMTRRLLKPQPFASGYYDVEVEAHVHPRGKVVRFNASAVGGGAVLEERRDLPYSPGNILWVRETHWRWGWWDYQPDGIRKWRFLTSPQTDDVIFEDPRNDKSKPMKRTAGVTRWWRRPAIFLPRKFSRLTLRVTDVAVERLRDISEADAEAEGADRIHNVKWPDGDPGTIHDTRRRNFAQLWNSINGHGAWEANPWVVAVRFSIFAKNVDSLPPFSEAA